MKVKRYNPDIDYVPVHDRPIPAMEEASSGEYVKYSALQDERKAHQKGIKKLQSKCKELEEDNKKIKEQLEKAEDALKSSKDETDSVRSILEREKSNSYSLGRADTESEFEEQLEKERGKKKEIGLFLKGIIRRDWHLESIRDRARDLETLTQNQE